MRVLGELWRDDPFTPVYERIERDFLEHLDHVWATDKQLDVYSPVAADLVLRSVSEIETLAKALYRANCPTNEASEERNPPFDDVCLAWLSEAWNLKTREVSANCSRLHLDDRVLKPFHKPRKGYLWNRAYQDLKHDRAEHLSSGSVRNALHALAALNLLLLLWRKPHIEAMVNLSDLDFGFGSTVFSYKPVNEGSPDDDEWDRRTVVLMTRDHTAGGLRHTLWGFRLNYGGKYDLPEGELVKEDDGA